MDNFIVTPGKTNHRITSTGKILRVVGSQTSADQTGVDTVVRDMRHYWEMLRQNHSVPLRSQISVDGIDRMIDYAFLIERIAPGMARFRLVGQHLQALMGMELRGMPLCSLMNRDSRKDLCLLTETVFRAPQIAEMRVTSESSQNQSKLTGTLLLLPLRSDLDDVSRALGCLATKGGVGSAPRRFDIRETILDPIIPGGKILHPTAPENQMPG